MTTPEQPKISDLPHTEQLAPILCLCDDSYKDVVWKPTSLKPELNDGVQLSHSRGPADQ
jgi:hypothetical protein